MRPPVPPPLHVTMAVVLQSTC